MGTFLPLAISLAVTCDGVDFGNILFFSGVYNLLTGATFRVPMPVQPMKTICGEAIASRMNVYQIVSAGLVTSAVVTLLGVSGVTTIMEKHFPVGTGNGTGT